MHTLLLTIPVKMQFLTEAHIPAAGCDQRKIEFATFFYNQDADYFKKKYDDI